MVTSLIHHLVRQIATFKLSCLLTQVPNAERWSITDALILGYTHSGNTLLLKRYDTATEPERMYAEINQSLFLIGELNVEASAIDTVYSDAAGSALPNVVVAWLNE